MNRREFILNSSRLAGAIAAGGALGSSLSAPAAEKPARLRIAWQRDTETNLFFGVTADGAPLVTHEQPGLLAGFCRLAGEDPAQDTWLGTRQPSGIHGPLRVELRHRLRDSGLGADEDLLEGTLTVINTSKEPQTVVCGFATSIQPGPEFAKQCAYLPLAATGLMHHSAMHEVGQGKVRDPEQAIGEGAFVCYYLEPFRSDPPVRSPDALLLVPVIRLFHTGVIPGISLMTESGKPRRFATLGQPGPERGWSLGTRVILAPGQRWEDRCWVLVHAGDAQPGWRAFPQFAHDDRLPRIPWLPGVKVHYYDFLSPEKPGGKRGLGFDAAVPNFREFRVGLATQHGYYPCMGDHIHPDRKTWLAMQGDKPGAFEMSLDRVRERISATRKARTRAGIYMHLTAMDDSSKEFWPGLRDARLVGPNGQPIKYPWNGPDVKGGLWQMSIAAPEWRNHLLQQARWIMEVWKPDAICMDETFAGLGYDYHPSRQGALSAHAIEFFKQMRALVRSFGKDRAFITSDCSLAGFVPWADGECGDHAYEPLLGHPLYRKIPVRFRAALGDKPWVPCAWHFQKFWGLQMELARIANAGVGVSNGWIEYTGLHGLPADVRAKMIADIGTLFTTR